MHTLVCCLLTAASRLRSGWSTASLSPGYSFRSPKSMDDRAVDIWKPGMLTECGEAVEEVRILWRIGTAYTRDIVWVNSYWDVDTG